MGYLDLTNGFIYKDPVFRAKLDALAENDAYLKLNGWQTSTKAIFFQAAAPTGWTKDTTNTGKALRAVTGVTGGTTGGGSYDVSGAIALAHTAHGIAMVSQHTHRPGTSQTHGLLEVSPSVTGKTSFQSYLIGSGNTAVRTVSNGATTRNILYHSLADFDYTVDEYDESTPTGDHDHGGVTTTAALTDLTLKYVDVLVCTKSTSSGYVDMTAAFTSGDEITYQDLDKLAENDKFNEARLTPSSTIMPFGQVSAPTGWTKETTNDDTALRVVSGTGGGTGGSTGFGSSINLTHNHTTASEGTHTHALGNHRHHITEFAQASVGLVDTGHVSFDGSGRLVGTDDTAGTQTAIKGRTLKDGGGSNMDASGSHTHTIGSSLTTIQIAYLDVILCSKNSSGSSSVYTDMSAVWVFKILVSKQRLNKMAANDDYILYHTVESASRTFFSMASPPVGWTKLLTQHDKALRVVSGTSGGSTGGSQSPSAVISLAHTHTISSVSHGHAAPSHTHVLETYSETSAGAQRNPISLGSALNGSMWEKSGTVINQFRPNKTSTSSTSNSANSVSHDHGGVTGSLLTDITLAYQDVIYCSKD